MNTFLSNSLAIISICLTLGLYAKLPSTIPVTLEQVRAANQACIQHLGPKHYLEQTDPAGFKAKCQDGTLVAGKIPPLKRTGAHQT